MYGQHVYSLGNRAKNTPLLLCESTLRAHQVTAILSWENHIVGQGTNCLP